MQPLAIRLNLNPNLYIKDPQTTTLGKKIIEHSVLLIDQLGLDQFTFKKLGKIIHSNEASIYRYFENKHQLFVYLLNWYWEWLIVRIEYNTMNIDCPSQKLEIVLNLIVDTANRNTAIEFVDEEVLHNIVVREGTKAYHHKAVDSDNQEGFFHAYKRLCEKIAAILRKINPLFPYPRALASTLIESANNNLYFARHLPRLTDLKGKDQALSQQVKAMISFFSFGLIKSKLMTQARPIRSSTPINQTQSL